MRILVTGGAGFIGSHLVELLLALGHEVTCVDNFDGYYARAVKRQNLSSAFESSLFQFVEADILDRAALEPLLDAAPDAVVHLAARPGVRGSVDDPAVYARVNIEGTATLLDLSRRHRVRHFVFASSSSVYGLSRTIPFTEDKSRLLPLSPYGASKLAAEHFCRSVHKVYGLAVTCLRFFTVYGPRQRPDMAIHRFTRLIDSGQPVPLYGDGSARRDYTYVSDVIDGVVRAITSPRGYRVYNLGTHETVALRDLIAIIEQALGKRAIVTDQPEQPGDVPLTHASIARAKRDLGYAPRVSIEEGVRSFVAWFRTHSVSGTPQGSVR